MIMTELLASQQASDIEETTSVKEKTAMLSPPSRSVSAPHKNRILTNNSARNSAHVSVDNNSRTTTAFHNTGEDGSAGSKMFGSPVRRSFGKSSVSPVSQKKLSTNLPETSLLKIENEYAVKKKRYLSLKKDLLEKQKAAQNLYNEMSMLYEKLIANCNRDPGKPEIIKIIIGVTKYMPSSDHNNQNEHALIQVERLSIGQELLDSLESRLREIPRRSQSLCQELLRKQLSFVTFVTSHLINVSEDNKDTNSVSSILTLELEHYQKDYDDLRSRLKDIEVLEDRSVTELIQNIRRMIEEYESSRAKLIELNAADTQRELQVQLNTTAEELQAEKEKNVQGKDRLRQTETQLQRARTKIKELEAHVENDDGKIQQLQVSLKALESQVKQKELGMDNKLKEMQKVIKNSENLLNKVEKQRDSLEARLVELREKIAIKENEEMGKIKELSEKLSAATADALTERQKKMEIEEAFTDLRDRYKNLEEKSNQLCELAEKNKDLAIIEGNHTENEVRLFKELETTRDELEAQRRLILQLQQEKEEIVAVMHQAANRDEDKDSRENLAAELVFKSTELQNLMMKYSEVKKIAKNAQEKNGMLERQLEEIQARLHSQSVEGGSAGLSAHAIELQQEISDLRSNLAEVTQQKEEVEAALTQKQLELEQRDHVMRQQSKFLKARDELLEALNGKVQQENGELSTSNENNEYLEEVHKQIAAKTEALQELYTTLKNKQLQIMHLEKMVKLMEVQQDRAQAQRTRLENRIAQLELTLHRSKEQRNKGFGIL